MSIDWEELLDAYGDDLDDAYEQVVEEESRRLERDDDYYGSRPSGTAARRKRYRTRY